MDVEPWAQLCRLAAGQHGVVSTADLHQHHIGPGAVRTLLRRRQLERRDRGAYVLPGTPRTWWQDLLVAQVSTGAAVTHRSSAALHGFDRCALGPFDLSVPLGRRVARPGVVVHVALDLERDLTTLGPFVVTNPVRTLLDLAAVVPVAQLQHAVDGALRDGVVQLDDLRRRFDERRRMGRNGVKAMAEVLQADAMPGAPESVLERMFLRLLDEHGLPRPRLQVDHGHARVDAQWDEAKLIVELDGHLHHATEPQRRHDNTREARLVLGGWRVLRFTYWQVRNEPHVVVGTLRRFLARAVS